MSEFNTGKPPAGEAGMLVIHIEGMTGEFHAYWDRGGLGWRDRPGGQAWEMRHVPASGGFVDWRWATLAELTAAGIPESEARGMVHKSMLADAPWYPPQQEGFGPWVEHTPGSGRPVADGVIVACLYADEREAQKFTFLDDQAKFWRWAEGNIVAYCEKLEDKPAIAATCAPPSEPAQEAPEDGAAMNAAMLQRDQVEQCEKPLPVASSPREPEPWHQRVAPWTNRFGGWGA